MPEAYIIQRFASEEAGLTSKLWNEYMTLPDEVKNNVDKVILSNKFHSNQDEETPLIEETALSFLENYG